MLPSSRAHHTQLDSITIRPAIEEEVHAIVTLVNSHALRGDLLPRDPLSVYRTLNDWLVAEAHGQILGCVSLLPYSSGLVEVRSLAIQDGLQGLGIGRRLMRSLLQEAQRRRVSRLFALTRAVRFFERFGFVATEKERFPEKIWRDCRLCPFLENCDEIAMILDLTVGEE